MTSVPHLLFPLSGEPCPSVTDTPQTSPDIPVPKVCAEFQVFLAHGHWAPEHMGHLMFQMALSLVVSEGKRVLFLAPQPLKVLPRPMHRMISLPRARTWKGNPLKRLKLAYPKDLNELLQYLAALSVLDGPQRPQFEAIIIPNVVGWAPEERDMLRVLAQLENLRRNASLPITLADFSHPEETVYKRFQGQMGLFAQKIWLLNHCPDTAKREKSSGYQPRLVLQAQDGDHLYKFLLAPNQDQYFPTSVDRNQTMK